MIAITRAVSSGMQDCELVHLERSRLDMDVLYRQHESYEAALASLGCSIQRLPEEPEYPDSVFVEDTALVFDELAVMTRPGADSRRGERKSIQAALAPHRELRHIEGSASLDGGDVFRIGRDVFVGASTRSNAAAIDQLQEILRPYGYTVRGAGLRGCLHLKSAVTPVGQNMLLLNPEWVDPQFFAGRKIIEVDPSEASAANGLLLGETLLYATEFPKTRRRLESEGVAVRTVEMSEFAKAEGAITCCSLILDENSSR